MSVQVEEARFRFRLLGVKCVVVEERQPNLAPDRHLAERARVRGDDRAVGREGSRDESERRHRHRMSVESSRTGWQRPKQAVGRPVRVGSGVLVLVRPDLCPLQV
eukprot:975158-Rhodomonas_salina.5